MSEEFQGRLFPKEAAEAIGIAAATLRKYSQIVEEVTQDEDFFDRTDQNIRTYSSKDVILLKRIAVESKEEGLSVKDFTTKLLNDEPQLFESPAEESDTTEVTNPLENTQAVSSSVMELLKIIDQQNQKIDQLMQMMTQFTTDIRSELTDVKPMIERSQQLLEHNEKQMSEMQEDIAETKAVQQEQIETQNKALGDSPFNTEATTNNTSVEEDNPEEKVGFFQRLFGKH